MSSSMSPSCPLLPPSSFALNPSQHQGLFQWVSSLHQVDKYWSFSFSISPCNEYSGLISFMIDWFDGLAVQGTLKSLLQPHSSKASILWCSAFFNLLVLNCSAMSDFLWPHGLQPASLLCPWGFSRQKYWSELPCPSPEDLPNLGTEPRSPTLWMGSLLSEPAWKSLTYLWIILIFEAYF